MKSDAVVYSRNGLAREACAIGPCMKLAGWGLAHRSRAAFISLLPSVLLYCTVVLYCTVSIRPCSSPFSLHLAVLSFACELCPTVYSILYTIERLLRQAPPSDSPDLIETRRLQLDVPRDRLMPCRGWSVRCLTVTR